VITERNASAQLKAEFNLGTDEKGEPILSVRSFGDMDPEAGGESVLKAARALAGLADYQMERCLKSIVTEVVETI
jgi:hypothetical protein